MKDSNPIYLYLKAACFTFIDVQQLTEESEVVLVLLEIRLVVGQEVLLIVIQLLILFLEPRRCIRLVALAIVQCEVLL